MRRGRSFRSTGACWCLDSNGDEMKIYLPDTAGMLHDYELTGTPCPQLNAPSAAPRVVYAAAHVVADPYTNADPSGEPVLDLEATMRFRRYLAEMGLGIAEAMDTAQRGMGLNWPAALEIIRCTRQELPNAMVANGCGTDHLDPSDAWSLDDLRTAYLKQVEDVQAVGGRVIVMASRSLSRVAKDPEDYLSIYDSVISACDEPVILHWLGEMFDPELAGYWGTVSFEEALGVVLAIIDQNSDKIDGIKMSLLDKNKEIMMRRRLPEGVRMYTGDDFNYPELIEGDDQGFSHALLGIFDAIAPCAALALSKLADGDVGGFRAVLDPTVPLARHMFRAPTRFYKSGVVFLAWLNGFQDHFVMLGGAQSLRPLPYFVEIFKMADKCGLLRDPELGVSRMKGFLKLYGI